MKGVLVTGATTPLGRRLIEVVRQRHPAIPVVGVGLETVPRHLTREVEYVRADLTRSRDLKELLFGIVRRLGIDTVAHAAFHRSPGHTGRKAHALHVEATRELLSVCEEHPTVQSFVLASSATVYRIEARTPALVGEGHPLALSPEVPENVRHRVEADWLVCARMGLSRLDLRALRFAEILAPDCGSQLWDYLQTRVALRPLGFDPMLNVLSLDDAARAFALGLEARGNGVFNVPGADTLPLSEAVRKWGRTGIGLPGPLLAPLYRLRASTTGLEFRYDMNHLRFHFSAVLDGSRARNVLGYQPEVPIDWPATGRVMLPPRRTNTAPASPERATVASS